MSRKLYIHRTQTGRVVYERAKHFLTEKDVERLTRTIFSRLRKQGIGDLILQAVEQAIYNLSIGMLTIILELWGAGYFAPIVYGWMNSMIGWILKQIGLISGYDVQKSLATALMYKLVNYTPDLIIVDKSSIA